jgi:hypothetical protein
MPFEKGKPPVTGFKPGQSGNPGGVSKLKKQLKEAFRESTAEAHDKMLDIMRGEAPDRTETQYVTVYDKNNKPILNPDGTRKQKRIDRVYTQSVPVDLQLEAARLIAERALGKPVQPISGEDDGAPIGLALNVREIRRVIIDATDQREKIKTIEHNPDENNGARVRRLTNGS